MTLPGSTAKVQMIREMAQKLAAEPGRIFRALDVGVTGPEPLGFWEPLFKYKNLELVGVDVDAASIEALKRRTLPAQVKTLEVLTGYDIATRFGKGAFDMVVSTQVLEHMRHPERFLKAAHEVLKPGGDLYLCYDNGLYPRARNHNMLREHLKQLHVLLTGSERFHDKDLEPDEVIAMLKANGYKVLSDRLYNLHPIKDIHGHELAAEHADAFMDLWLQLENFLNDHGHAASHPKRYLVAYVHAITQ